MLLCYVGVCLALLLLIHGYIPVELIIMLCKKLFCENPSDLLSLNCLSHPSGLLQSSGSCNHRSSARGRCQGRDGSRSFQTWQTRQQLVLVEVKEHLVCSSTSLDFSSRRHIKALAGPTLFFPSSLCQHSCCHELTTNNTHAPVSPTRQLASSHRTRTHHDDSQLVRPRR